MIEPTLVGYVAKVSGSTISVHQVASVASGLSMINGRLYRVGQVGSFVKIPQGYQSLYGIVSEVGANPDNDESVAGLTSDTRWLTVQLVGESTGTAFERGISQHPNINDEVHVVTDADLGVIYGFEDSGGFVLGRLSSAESITAQLDLDKLVTRHSAVVGSTGAGKSTTVTSLLRSMADGGALRSGRILLFDIHGEYSRALADVAEVFRINAFAGQTELVVPFWALEYGELQSILFGSLAPEKESVIRDKIVELKLRALSSFPRAGAAPTSVTVDTPVPFSLHQFWYELYDQEIMTLEGPDRDQPALIKAGQASTLTPSEYKKHGLGSKGPFLNTRAPGIRRSLDHLRSRLLDRRFDFLLHPGVWEPAASGQIQKDLDDLLKTWLGHSKPITLLDLSGVPADLTGAIVGALLRVIYDAMFWSREKSEGAINRPVLFVMEEAHAYLSSEMEGPSAAKMVKRIVKEGRKYGLGAMIVSQRPSEIDETVFSQCGTFVSMRLSNVNDRARVKSSLPDSLAGLMDMLPILRTGEAIVTGEAARLPMRVRVSLPAAKHRPESQDPEVAERWRGKRLQENYGQVVAAWRAQSPRFVWNKPTVPRMPVPPGEE